MSRQNSQKSETERLAQEQAREIIRECLDKKFDGNRAQMEVWLTGIRGRNPGVNVERWITNTQVPGWVLLRIFAGYDDLKGFAFAGGEAKRVDPAVDTLRQRIDRLMESEFLLKHFEAEAVICETFLRDSIEAATAAQIVQKSKELTPHQKEMLLKELQRDAMERGPGILREGQNRSQQDAPRKTRQDTPGSPGVDPKGKAPPRKR